MDDQRFDHLTRELATSLPRRGALRSLIATAAGALAFRGADVGAARDRATTPRRCRRGKCSAGYICCEGYCLDIECCGGTGCSGGQVCVDHVCAACGVADDCPEGFPCVNNVCTECVVHSDCDDGLICTVDVCVGGFCEHRPHLCAPSQDPCFVNVCVDQLGGCFSIPQTC